MHTVVNFVYMEWRIRLWESISWKYTILRGKWTVQHSQKQGLGTSQRLTWKLAWSYKKGMQRAGIRRKNPSIYPKSLEVSLLIVCICTAHRQDLPTLLSGGDSLSSENSHPSDIAPNSFECALQVAWIHQLLTTFRHYRIVTQVVFEGPNSNHTAQLKIVIEYWPHADWNSVGVCFPRPISECKMGDENETKKGVAEPAKSEVDESPKPLSQQDIMEMFLNGAEEISKRVSNLESRMEEISNTEETKKCGNWTRREK